MVKDSLNTVLPIAIGKLLNQISESFSLFLAVVLLAMSIIECVPGYSQSC